MRQVGEAMFPSINYILLLSIVAGSIILPSSAWRAEDVLQPAQESVVQEEPKSANVTDVFENLYAEPKPTTPLSSPSPNLEEDIQATENIVTNHIEEVTKSVAPLLVEESSPTETTSTQEQTSSAQVTTTFEAEPNEVLMQDPIDLGSMPQMNTEAERSETTTSEPKPIEEEAYEASTSTQAPIYFGTTPSSFAEMNAQNNIMNATEDTRIQAEAENLEEKQLTALLEQEEEEKLEPDSWWVSSFQGTTQPQAQWVDIDTESEMKELLDEFLEDGSPKSPAKEKPVYEERPLQRSDDDWWNYPNRYHPNDPNSSATDPYFGTDDEYSRENQYGTSSQNDSYYSYPAEGSDNQDRYSQPQDPYPQAQNPYNQPQDPYAQDPYSQPTDPYRQDPYAKPEDAYNRTEDTYRQPDDPYNRPNDPYAQDPYAQPQDPYRNQDDTYNQPQDPYVQPQDPYNRNQDTYSQSRDQDDPYTQPLDPYNRPQDTYSQPRYPDDLYNQTQDPYSQDPYAQSRGRYSQPDDPYEQPQDPYARDPYAQPNDPYDSYNRTQDPYAQPQDPYPEDPYRQPTDPYSQPQDPYAQPQDSYEQDLYGQTGQQGQNSSDEDYYFTGESQDGVYYDSRSGQRVDENYSRNDTYWSNGTYPDVNNNIQEEYSKEDPIQPPEEDKSYIPQRGPTPWPRRDVYRQGMPQNEACKQELSPGDGPDETNSWYFDSQSGECRWFAYSGYGGNANRFYSRQSCEKLCIEDNSDPCSNVECPSQRMICSGVMDEDCLQYYQGRPNMCPPAQPVCLTRRGQGVRVAPKLREHMTPDICSLPKDPGTCQQDKDKIVVAYYYQKEQKICQSFYFSKCGGNDNRFTTKEECMNYCSP